MKILALTFLFFLNIQVLFSQVDLTISIETDLLLQLDPASKEIDIVTKGELVVADYFDEDSSFF